jgi:hypothetical protein
MAVDHQVHTAKTGNGISLGAPRTGLIGRVEKRFLFQVNSVVY